MNIFKPTNTLGKTCLQKWAKYYTVMIKNF